MVLCSSVRLNRKDSFLCNGYHPTMSVSIAQRSGQVLLRIQNVGV